MAIPYRSKADRALATASTQPVGEQYKEAVARAMKEVRSIQKLEKLGARWQYLRALGMVLDEMHAFVREEHERIRTDMRKAGEED